ncbi:MAG TPA: bacitracin ABC transporter permease, partial [Firmicutes bacterium]|nr:bacitracin ABC transporter permease [Bacillota bacterium]
KNILTIPISRTRLFMSKLILLLIWILFLTMFAWGLTLIFGVIGQFQGLSAAVLMTAFKEYIVG